MIELVLVPVLTGGLFVNLLWPNRDLRILFLKAFLGIGIGLGISSILYFTYLLIFAGQHWFMAVQWIIFIILCMATFYRETRGAFSIAAPVMVSRPTRMQIVLAFFGILVFLISLASTASYLLRRRQGDWDAWMMYNRAARFIYRDQVNWLESFSPKIDPLFHADYPLLLAMNISSGWDLLGNDSPHVPMVESALFALASVGVMVCAMVTVKSIGQASLGMIILWGTPVFVNEGAREMADVPLAFFILTTFVLIYLFVIHRKPGLIILCGLSAGFAAWTKNEGSVFVIGVFAALLIAFVHEKPLRIISLYILGLAPALAIVLYFKLFVAPPSDVLSNGAIRSIEQVFDPARHAEIVRFFWGQFFSFGNWGIPGLATAILPILMIYYLVFHGPIDKERRPAFVAGGVMLAVQSLGYYGIYLITPYDLTWHLTYSVTRIFLQVFPMVTFFVLCASRTPEAIFDYQAVH